MELTKDIEIAELRQRVNELLSVCIEFDNLIQGDYDDPVIQPELLQRLKNAIK